MPINIPEDLPAHEALTRESIFVMTEDRAKRQDIRPLQIAIVNLMPTKIATETQILRLLGNSPIQVDITLVRAECHVSQNTSLAHMDKFYTCFSQIKHRKFDGMVITGAPVEHLPFEDVDYWSELQQVMDYTKTNVFSTLHICWGAQAGLYHHYGIPKYTLPQKTFGVFPHSISNKNFPLFRGFDDVFYAPHSRHTEVKAEDIVAEKSLDILAESEQAGVCIAFAEKYRHFFITGHLEYDADTLSKEYFRDLDRGLAPNLPNNYFKDNDPSKPPMVNWRAHANLFFSNWINFYVYQDTPFELDAIGQK